MVIVLSEKISAQSDAPCLRNGNDFTGFFLKIRFREKVDRTKKCYYFHIENDFSFRICFTLKLYLNTQNVPNRSRTLRSIYVERKNEKLKISKILAQELL